MNILQKLLPILILSLPSLIYAQFGYGKYKDLEELKDRVLVVELKEAEEKDLEFIEKIYKKKPDLIKEKTKEYKASIEAFNNMIKPLIDSLWHFNKKIVYKKASEVERLKKKKGKSNYAFFRYFFQIERDNVSKSSNRKIIFINSLEVGLIENKRGIALLNLPSSKKITKAELTFGIEQLQQYFNWRIDNEVTFRKQNQYFKALESEAEILKEKILLFDEKNISDGFKIEEYYPYSYEITSKEKIDKVILERNPKYVYVMITPERVQTFTESSSAPFSEQRSLNLQGQNSVIYGLYFVNAESGKLIGWVKGKLKTDEKEEDITLLFTKKEFKEIEKLIE